MENTKRYKAVWDELDDGLLYGVSVVDTPANQYEFVMMSKDKIKLKVEDKMKQQLTGVVLVPNQVIERYSEKRGHYEVIFEADTIEKFAHNFIDKGLTKNSWYNHDQKEEIKSSSVVESWIINDETMDKAFSMGFKDLPKGTWMITMKLGDEDWKKYIESGKAVGFSIDSYISLERMLFSSIDNNKNNNNKKESEIMANVFKEFIKFMSDKEEMKDKEEVKMLEIPMEEGQPLMVESLEVGMVVTRDGEVMADSEFTFEGKEFETDSEGKIKEMEVKEEVDASEDKKEEVDASEDKEEDKLDLTDEEAKKELFDMISKDPELEEVLKSKYGKSEKESIDMSLELAGKDKNVKSRFEKLFLSEKESLNDTIESKDKEILELKEQLEETPNTGKIKAETNLSSRKKGESMLEAIERIKSSNK